MIGKHVAVRSTSALTVSQGIVITGSKHDAHGMDPWIVKLREVVKSEAQRGQMLLGLCFGAQLLAHALGGKSGESCICSPVQKESIGVLDTRISLMHGPIMTYIVMTYM